MDVCVYKCVDRYACPYTCLEARVLQTVSSALSWFSWIRPAIVPVAQWALTDDHQAPANRLYKSSQLQDHPALGLRAPQAMIGFLPGCWGSGPGPHGCRAGARANGSIFPASSTLKYVNTPWVLAVSQCNPGSVHWPCCHGNKQSFWCS